MNDERIAKLQATCEKALRPYSTDDAALSTDEDSETFLAKYEVIQGALVDVPWLLAELVRLRHADSICRKLAAEPDVVIHEHDGLRVFGFVAVALDAGELAYLQTLTHGDDERKESRNG